MLLVTSLLSRLGGPLIVKNDRPENDVIVGLVSWGVKCAFLVSFRFCLHITLRSTRDEIVHQSYSLQLTNPTTQNDSPEYSLGYQRDMIGSRRRYVWNRIIPHQT